jgi:hypothetical protein
MKITSSVAQENAKQLLKRAICERPRKGAAKWNGGDKSEPAAAAALTEVLEGEITTLTSA